MRDHSVREFPDHRLLYCQDDYGGPVANRARFMLEVLEAMIVAAGPGRVGLKLSPEVGFNDIHDENPAETYAHLVAHLDARRMAYLHVTTFGPPVTDYHALLRPHFDGAYLLGGGLDKETAETLLADSPADATVFGALFLSNPDLVERFRKDAPLHVASREALYSAGAEGYTDQPTLADERS